MMNLQIVKRSKNKKSEVRQLRRDGHIPAVLYVRETEGQFFSIRSSEFSGFLRNVKPGHLPTTLFTLVDEQGKKRKAIIKDIQYNITTYDVIHLDFEELSDNVPVNVKVPIECTRVADCIGVKLGGVLRQVIRHLRVRCLPKDIPSFFTLDVASLDQRQSKRLSDLEIPNTVKPLVDLNVVAVAIVKR
jgi:large subunit ribosomal protein L25